MRVWVLVAAGALAACGGPPEGIGEEDVARYKAAVASIGCELQYDSDYVPVEFQAGLTREQSLAITTYMLSTDQAVKDADGAVRLTTGACA